MSQDKQEKKKIKGIVAEALADTNFRVKLEDGSVVLAYLCGKMRIHRIRVIPGDEVIVEMSAYDDQRGRIIQRGYVRIERRRRR